MVSAYLWERMLKNMIMVQFELLPWDLPGKTEENDRNPHLG
jgi:hypothetical protein